MGSSTCSTLTSTPSSGGTAKASSVCFLTGLYSHLQQNPVQWLPIPARPAGLYRVTQGLHVAAGIASVPVLVAKLWLVWPRFVALPLARRASQVVERIGLLPLVGGGIFLAFSGVANIAQWYPWRFSFTASHYWMAWVTMGSIVAHVGAKWATTRPQPGPAVTAPAPRRGRPGARNHSRGRRRRHVPAGPPGNRGRRVGSAHPDHHRPDGCAAAAPRAARASRPHGRAPGAAGEPPMRCDSLDGCRPDVDAARRVVDSPTDRAAVSTSSHSASSTRTRGG